MPTTTKRLTMAEIHTLVEGFIKGLNTHDADAALSFCTDDVVFKEPFQPRVRGKDTIRPRLMASWKAFKDVHFPLEDVHVYPGEDRTSAVVVYTMIATMGGPAFGVAGTGRTMRVTATMITKFRDGLISDGVILYDSVQAAEQLGLLPRSDGLAMRLIMAAETATTMARRALRL